MEVDFADDDLRRLEADASYTAGFSPPIVKKFRMRMQQIRAATDERDLRTLRSLRFKKLKGERAHEHSMRLNDQWRLVVQIIGKKPKTVLIVSIEDYH